MTIGTAPWRIFSKKEWTLIGSTYLRFASQLLDAIDATQSRKQPVELTNFIELAKSYTRLGEVCNDLAAMKKAGRPRAMPDAELTADLQQSLYRPRNALMMGHSPPSPKKRRGRPVTSDESFDIATYELVEFHRAELMSGNRQKPTTKAALESVLSWFASTRGKRVSTTIKERFDTIKAAYYRGKKLSQTRSEFD